MKGQELIDFIVKHNAQELEVCIFGERGAICLEDVDLYIGRHSYPSPKLVHMFTDGKYFGLGNPGDFDLPDLATPYEEPKPEQCAQQMSFDEIVDDMIARMDADGKKTWLEVSENDLILGHMSTGQAIRNYYRLWEEGNPICAGKHPDDVSMEIMKAVWTKLNEANPGHVKVSYLRPTPKQSWYPPQPRG